MPPETLNDAPESISGEIKPSGPKPTIGRIVNFHDGVQIVPAIIVFVGQPENSESWVNLRVFTDNDTFPRVTSVGKNPATNGEHVSYTWDWPKRN